MSAAVPTATVRGTLREELAAHDAAARAAALTVDTGVGSQQSTGRSSRIRRSERVAAAGRGNIELTDAQHPQALELEIELLDRVFPQGDEILSAQAKDAAILNIGLRDDNLTVKLIDGVYAYLNHIDNLRTSTQNFAAVRAPANQVTTSNWSAPSGFLNAEQLLVAINCMKTEGVVNLLVRHQPLREYFIAFRNLVLQIIPANGDNTDYARQLWNLNVELDRKKRRDECSIFLSASTVLGIFSSDIFAGLALYTAASDSDNPATVGGVGAALMVVLNGVIGGGLIALDRHCLFPYDRREFNAQCEMDKRLQRFFLGQADLGEQYDDSRPRPSMHDVFPCLWSLFQMFNAATARAGVPLPEPPASRAVIVHVTADAARAEQQRTARLFHGAAAEGVEMAVNPLHVAGTAAPQ